MEITTVGLDLAKSAFHVVCFDGHGHEVKKRMLKRAGVRTFFAQLAPCTIGLEACAGSHYWARELTALGHRVTLLPAQHVKAYLQGQKNDYNDARAIVAALGRPGRRTVAVKTQAQQDVQALHRLRSQCVKERTAQANALRGLLAEYGVVVGRGLAVLRRRLPEVLEDAENGLSAGFRVALRRGQVRLAQADADVAFFTAELARQAADDEAVRLLQTAPGFGPLNASAFASALGNGAAYRRGRDVGASLGLVPAQASSGGKPRLLGISKCGDRYLRTLLVHGARAVVAQAQRKDDDLSRWLRRLCAERGRNKAIVAMANKMARIGWAILRSRNPYRAEVGDPASV
jgi:transposase